MVFSESNALFNQSCDIYSKLIKCLEQKATDKASLEQALSHKQTLDNISRKLKELQESDIVYDSKSTSINTSLLFATSSATLINDSAEILIQFIKDKKYDSFAVMKEMVKDFTEKLQKQTSSQTEEEIKKDENRAQRLMSSDVFYTLIRATEDPTCIMTLQTKDGAIVDNDSVVDNKDNSFYWMSCILMYRQNIDILEDNEPYKIERIIKFDKSKRERLFKLVAMCRWVVKNYTKINNHRTERLIVRMNKYLDNITHITNLNRLCNPYAYHH